MLRFPDIDNWRRESEPLGFASGSFSLERLRPSRIRTLEGLSGQTTRLNDSQNDAFESKGGRRKVARIIAETVRRSCRLNAEHL